MKNKLRQEAIKAELNNRTKCAYMAGATEFHFSTSHRLLYCLCRPNPLSSGQVPTIRAYYLKYDRQEYRRIIKGIRFHNKNNGFKLFNNGLANLNGCFDRITDLKLTHTDKAIININLLWH